MCVFRRGHEAATGVDPEEPAEGTTRALCSGRLSVSDILPVRVRQDPARLLKHNLHVKPDSGWCQRAAAAARSSYSHRCCVRMKRAAQL